MNIQTRLSQIEAEFDERYVWQSTKGYDTTPYIIKNANEIKSFYTSQIKSLLKEYSAFLADKVDWILTPHAYESDDPKMEKFARGIKEKYKKEIVQAITTSQSH